MKKRKKINYYRSLLHKDSIALLVIAIIFTIILVILGLIFNQSLIGISWCSISILVVNIISIILCIILHHKKIKTVLVYIILVISIMITLFGGLFLIDEIGQNIRKNNYYDSEEFLIEYAKQAEEELQEDITQAGNLKKLNIDISKENIITLDNFLSTISDMYSIKELEERGYSCNGYAILKYKDSADKDYYNLVLNEEYNDTTDMNRFFDINTYISCSGKYSYTTVGFNEGINNKEEIFSIIVPESYFSFTNTQIEKNIESLKGLGNEYITSVKKENNTMVIEVTESQKNKLIERNNKYIETLSNGFSNANEKYHYEFNSDFSDLTYYFDEHIAPITQGKIGSITASYILNNILKTNNQDWQVHIRIINCHTNKLVAEGTLPKDTIKYGELEWNNSY